MNRIVLIGNGFDLAHDLPTGYKDFINNYWKDSLSKVSIINNQKQYKDKFITFFDYSNQLPQKEPITFSFLQKLFAMINPQRNLESLINSSKRSNGHAYDLSFNNNFFKNITEKNYLNSWLDIENEYYHLLKGCLKSVDRNERVKKLNKEFCDVKELLEKYLTEVCKKEVTKKKSIEEALNSLIKIVDVAISRKKEFDNAVPDFINNELARRHLTVQKDLLPEEDEKLYNIFKYNVLKDGGIPRQNIFLNFNYTNTVDKLYKKADDIVINIHGELNNNANPIIFGYGDELDDDYKEIEKTNDNDCLENIKSIHYHNTSNYRNLLKFLESEPYQVFIMGHSCGNSDRTLLNTIFEHPNCISIKPFYHEREDENNSGVSDNNYSDITRNISRNFTNKQNMRDIMVNKEFCKPLVPCIIYGQENWN